MARAYNIPNKKTTPKFIEEAKQLNIELDSYEKVNYINAHTAVIITCKLHGDYESIPHDYLRRKARCNKCKLMNQAINQTKTQEQFILDAVKINESNGNKDSFEQVIYMGSNEKIIVTCNLHGNYFISANDYLGGHRCSKCARTVSQKEQKWIDSFENHNIVQQKVLNINGKQLKVDGYDPVSNTVYEFYGDFWHGNPQIYNSNAYNKANGKTYGELYLKTKEKENIIKEAGFNLITIWEHDFILNSKESDQLNE